MNTLSERDPRSIRTGSPTRSTIYADWRRFVAQLLARTAGKPLIVEEFGVTNDPAVYMMLPYPSRITVFQRSGSSSRPTWCDGSFSTVHVHHLHSDTTLFATVRTLLGMVTSCLFFTHCLSGSDWRLCDFHRMSMQRA